MPHWPWPSPHRPALHGVIQTLGLLGTVGALTGCGRWHQLGEDITAAQQRLAQLQAETQALDNETARLEAAAVSLPVMQLDAQALPALEADTARLRRNIEEAQRSIEQVQHDIEQTQTILTLYQARYLEP